MRTPTSSKATTAAAPATTRSKSRAGRSIGVSGRTATVRQLRRRHVHEDQRRVHAASREGQHSQIRWTRRNCCSVVMAEPWPWLRRRLSRRRGFFNRLFFSGARPPRFQESDQRGVELAPQLALRGVPVDRRLIARQLRRPARKSSPSMGPRCPRVKRSGRRQQSARLSASPAPLPSRPPGSPPARSPPPRRSGRAGLRSPSGRDQRDEHVGLRFQRPRSYLAARGRAARGGRRSPRGSLPTRLARRARLDRPDGAAASARRARRGLPARGSARGRSIALRSHRSSRAQVRFPCRAAWW